MDGLIVAEQDRFKDGFNLIFFRATVPRYLAKPMLMQLIHVVSCRPSLLLINEKWVAGVTRFTSMERENLDDVKLQLPKIKLKCSAIAHSKCL